MRDLNTVKDKIKKMAGSSLMMWQTMFKAFMEHDLDFLSEALEIEVKLNSFEREITQDLAEIARGSNDKNEISKSLIYSDVVADLELIGDYCKDMLERIQIKIEEKLLFSQEAVDDFEKLYRSAEAALQEIAKALDKDDYSAVKEVFKNEEHIDTMVDDYRSRHNQRVVAGVCQPLACNMFLNILDFTAAVYYHTKKVARSLVKINSIK